MQPEVITIVKSGKLVSLSDLMNPRPPSLGMLSLAAKAKVVGVGATGAAMIPTGVTIGVFTLSLGIGFTVGMCVGGAALLGMSYGLYKFEISKLQTRSESPVDQDKQSGDTLSSAPTTEITPSTGSYSRTTEEEFSHTDTELTKLTKMPHANMPTSQQSGFPSDRTSVSTVPRSPRSPIIRRTNFGETNPTKNSPRVQYEQISTDPAQYHLPEQLDQVPEEDEGA